MRKPLVACVNTSSLCHRTLIMEKKTYLRISPDYDELYQDSEGCSYSGFGDAIYIYDRCFEGLSFSFVMPGIEEWLKRYERATDFADAITNPLFDWAAWHAEGLMFAKAIRLRLPRCYDLIYAPPYEDNSGLIHEITVDDNVDDIISDLKLMAKEVNRECALKHNVTIEAKRDAEQLQLHFAIKRSTYDIKVGLKELTRLRNWLLGIITDDKDAYRFDLYSCRAMFFFPQRIGSKTDMGQFWIVEGYSEEHVYEAYVNKREFVKAFYLAVLTELGFGIYDSHDSYPKGEVRREVWHAYNAFKCVEIENYIYGLSSGHKLLQSVDETFVMFQDYGGCIFWDTMGVGSGDSRTLYSDFGTFPLDIPGLGKWADYFDNPDPTMSFEDYWDMGWELAKQVRKILPENIDLFYMCYDPEKPEKKVNYNCVLPRLVVPRVDDNSWD